MGISRRAFLKTAAALTVAGDVRGGERHDGTNEAGARTRCDINGNLRRVAQELRASPAVQSVDFFPDEYPTRGCTQWRWLHFHSEELRQSDIPRLEEVNHNLFTAMRTVRDMPESGLDELMQEGMVLGEEREYLKDYRRLHRTMIRRVLRTPSPCDETPPVPLSPETIRDGMKTMENMTIPVRHRVHPSHEKPHTVRISPLARLGAGYALSRFADVRLLPAEDSEIFAKAKEADRNGTEEEKYRWILYKRNQHFVTLVRTYRREMQNVLVGAAHNLRHHIWYSNQKYAERISHMVVTVKGVQEALV